jgi:hypothetical protein
MAINLPIVSKFDNKGVKGATGAFEGMGKKLAVLGGVVATAFSIKAISDFAKESTLAAEAIQTSGARIDAIAQSMGVFGSDIDNVTKRLKDYADTNEQLLAVDENVIMQTQAKLLTFKELAETAGEAGGSFDRATEASINLAAAGFGAAETNAVQLGKALNDPITGLSALNRVGLTFTETEKEQIIQLQKSGDMLGAQDILLKALETQVGGTALATADASVKMGLAFGEIKETVGAALLPAFEGFTAAVLPLVQDLLPKISAVMEEKVTPALEAAVESFTALIERFREGESVGEIVKSIFTGIGDTVDEFLKNDGMTRIGNFFSGAFANMEEMRMSIFEAITSALPGIIDAFVEFLPNIVDFIAQTLIPTMLENLSIMITTLVELFAEVLPTLVEGITAVIPSVIEALGSLLPKIVTTLTDMIPSLLMTAVDLFMSLVNAVVEILPTLLTTIIEMLPSIMESVISMLPGIIEAAIELFNGLITALIDVTPVLLTAVLDLLPVLIDSLIEMLPGLIDGAFDLFTGLLTGLQDASPQLMTAAMGLIPELVTSLLKMIPQLVNVGFQIVSGLAKGIISSAASVLANAARVVGETISNGVKNVLQIRSPSKVFEGIGGDIIAGLDKGLGDGRAVLAKASVDMASTIEMSAVDGMGGMSVRSGSGAAQSSTIMNVTINAGVGSDPVSIGREVVNAIKRYESVSGKVFASV